MANDTILTPGGDHYTIPEDSSNPMEGFLQKDKYLSEFETEEEKAIVRENLNIPSRDSVYNKTESDTKLDETIKKAFQKYLIEEDPHGILPQVQQMIKDFVKNDGTTPFIAPQQGVDPIKDFHLVTKKYVTQVLNEHLKTKDPHEIIPMVENLLESYVKYSEVYFKEQLYTKDEIDKQGTQYIKKDGTTPFTKAQVGADPQIDSHLTTKRYVDSAIYKHLVDIDPHGFIQLLNQRLALYAKATNVYDKTETYSRFQIDAVIRSLVQDAAKDAIIDHINQHDPHNIMEEVRAEKYMKQDGSTPFKAPQRGVDAVEPQDLVTLKQLLEYATKLQTNIDISEPIWRTSGPVETTVGFVEDNQELPSQMTLQEILDAIFYGKSISIVTPGFVMAGHDCDLHICIHGSLAELEYAEVWQNDQLIYTLTKDHFTVDGEEVHCITLKSQAVTEDTEFKLKVYYTNGTVYEDSSFTKCSVPVFIGLLPKWKRGYTITMDYLEELSKETDIYNDKTYYNNQFVDWNENSITVEYHFQDPKLRHPFIVIPESYSNLEGIVTQSQKFGIEAFDVIDAIPLTVSGVNKDIIYKIYIYRQALSSLNQEVTFNFKSKE